MDRPVRLCGSSVLPGLVVLVVLCLLGSSVPARVLSPEGGLWLCAWEKEARRRARLTPRLRTCCGRCRAGMQPRPWPRSSASTLAPPRCPAGCWARPVSPLPGVAPLLCCPSSACLQVSLHHSLALRVGLALAQGSMGPAGVVCVCGHVAVGGRALPDRGPPSALFCLEVILLLPNNPLNSGELWLPALLRVPRTGGRTARGPELLAPGTASHSVLRGYGCPRG